LTEDGEETEMSDEIFAVGDTVVMIRPGPEHHDEGLYKGVSTVVVAVERPDSFLWISGKKSSSPLGCFSYRVKKMPNTPTQLEMF